MSDQFWSDAFDSRLPEGWPAALVNRLRTEGFGDFDAPLDDDEYVAELRTCPIPHCEWAIESEWRKGLSISRLRGLNDMESAARRHLRERHGWNSLSDTP
ncbi:hypothetical protein SEA_CULVER_1 [Gordonia phage Culver]|nr:hypothetical protein SEA_CULVER_1 [Gordonia phage Culver]